MVEYTTALAALTTEPAGIDFPSQTIVWPESNTGTAPTWSELLAKVQELQAAEPLRLLRLQRDRLISKTDWWVLPDRTATQAQLDYRQALRDITTQTPSLDSDGNLTGIIWPTPPND